MHQLAKMQGQKDNEQDGYNQQEQEKVDSSSTDHHWLYMWESVAKHIQQS
jgi:hypothetical protein